MQERRIQDYYLSAFSNSVYTVLQYIRGQNTELFSKLKTDEFIIPFYTDGRKGGIRGLDVHHQPVKHNRAYFIGEHAEISGNYIKLGDADCRIILRINGKEFDLYDLCEKSLRKIEVEVALYQNEIAKKEE